MKYDGETVTGTKAYPLIILDILREHTSRDAPVLITTIAEKMEFIVGHPVSRNTVARNIKTLSESYTIKKAPSGKGVYMDKQAGRELLDEQGFTDGELRCITDGILTSRYIAAPHTKALIDKVYQLSGHTSAECLQNVESVSCWPHQNNQQFFLTLETADEAITKGVQLRFSYNKVFNIKGLKAPARKGPYTVNPYAIINANGQYYLIANDKRYDNIKHYRMDRITDAELCKTKARSIIAFKGYERGLDVAEYARTHIYMYGGEPERIKLRMPQSLAGHVVDAFGSEGVMMQAVDDTVMEVRLKAAADGVKYFALQFGENCEVLEPESLRLEVKEIVKKMMERYGG